MLYKIVNFLRHLLQVYRIELALPSPFHPGREVPTASAKWSLITTPPNADKV
jgi:hypothetical protein